MVYIQIRDVDRLKERLLTRGAALITASFNHWQIVNILNIVIKFWAFQVDIGCVACVGSLFKFRYLTDSTIVLCSCI